MLRLALAGALSLACVITTHATDNGKYEGSDPTIREWFRTQRAPNSRIPCCDIADGRTTDYKQKDDGYWVPDPLSPSDWMHVPPDVVIRNTVNPIGEAIIWFMGDKKSIRCFIPTSEF